MPNFSRRNTHSLVMYADMGNILRAADSYCDSRFWLRKLDSVIQQISQSLLQPTTIPFPNYRSIGYLYNKSMIGSNGAQLFYNLFCQCHYITRLTHQRKLSRGETRGIEEI